MQALVFMNNFSMIHHTLASNIHYGTWQQMFQVISLLRKIRTIYAILIALINGTQIWQSPPVFLPGESHGRRRLVGYNPRGRKESDMTEWLHFTSSTLAWRNAWTETSGAWQATVHGSQRVRHDWVTNTNSQTIYETNRHVLSWSVMSDSLWPHRL